MKWPSDLDVRTLRFVADELAREADDIEQMARQRDADRVQTYALRARGGGLVSAVRSIRSRASRIERARKRGSQG